MMSPGAMVSTAFWTVRQGAAKVPADVSEPEGETKRMSPERTVKGRPLLMP